MLAVLIYIQFPGATQTVLLLLWLFVIMKILQISSMHVNIGDLRERERGGKSRFVQIFFSLCLFFF